MNNICTILAFGCLLIVFFGCNRNSGNPVGPSASWTMVASLPQGNIVVAIAVREPDIFVGTLGGADWTPVDSGFTGNYINVDSFVFLGSTVFAGLYEKGVYQFTGDGGSWTGVNNGLTDVGVGSLTELASALYIRSPGAVFVSWNNGSTWSDAGLAGASIDIASLASNAWYVFVGVGGPARGSGGGDCDYRRPMGETGVLRLLE